MKVIFYSTFSNDEVNNVKEEKIENQFIQTQSKYCNTPHVWC